MNTKLFYTAILLLLSYVGYAQLPMNLFYQRMPKPMTQIFSGSLLPLSGHTVCVKLIFDSIMIEGLTEEGYMERMVWYYDTKKVGKGYEWKQKWMNYRHSAFENWFLSSLALASSGTNIKWTKDTIADFIFRVQVTAIVSQAKISGEDENASLVDQLGMITLLHSSSTIRSRNGEQICVLSCDNIYGGPSFDDCQRILDCFNSLGYELGKMIKNKLR